MPPPDGLRPEQARAWQVLADGGSYEEAAQAAGRAVGTVSGWIRQWRNTHGPDLFRSERQQAAAEQTQAARQAAETRWAEKRVQAAINLGVTADRIASQLRDVLPTWGTVRVDRGPDGQQNPILIRGIDGREIKAAADGIARLMETSELLEDRPTKHHRRSVPADQWINPTGADNTGNRDPSADTQRAILQDPELAERYAALAEAIWDRQHPNDDA